MPTRQRINFPNQHNDSLAAVLELPDHPVQAYVLFAHCFSCGKDIAAASRISRTLAATGLAVLRFDFTGLGASEGDFGNTNFSSNIEDLLAAAAWLRAEYAAPQILIGHSLGGTAMLAAASQIPESRAVVTIGAPASPEHVLHQLSGQIPASGTSDDNTRIALAGREFLVSTRFLDDVRDHPLRESVAGLKKALLVFHAPFDDTVSIEEAGEIYSAAKHPKSFISLHGADHLLSRLEDAQYVANTITAWAARYLIDESAEKRLEVPGGDVFVGEGNRRFLRDIVTDDHAWLADEPKKVGGDNLGPDPYEHLLAALGACTSMTIRMYANRKKWPLENVTVQLQHSREHAQDCIDCETKSVQVDVLRREVKFEGPLDQVQRERLMEIADRCPVHKTLEGQIRIDTTEVS